MRPLPCEGRAHMADVRARSAAGRHAPCRAARRRPVRADGQIRDEVYEYGSFLQSRMYMAGVTCSNCHDPHSDALRLPGNALCAPCHLPTNTMQPSHHFHAAGTAGASACPAHAGAAVHGRRRPARSFVPNPAARRVGAPWHSEHLHVLPHEALERVGGRRGGEVARTCRRGAAVLCGWFRAGRMQQPEGASQLPRSLPIARNRPLSARPR